MNYLALKKSLSYTCFIILFVFCSIFPTVHLNAQTVEEKYDLSFKVVNDCNWSWLYSSTHCKFATQNTEQGNKPVLSISYYKVGWGDNTQFILSKTIIIPKNQRGKIEVTLTSKTVVTNPLQLMMKGLDKEGNEIASDSIAFYNKTWKKNTVSFMLGNSKAVRITLQYIGNGQRDQNILLQGIRIKIGGKDISKEDYFSKNKDDSLLISKSLDKSRIIQLNTSNDSTLLGNITGLDNKKIFGLGECTHGSLSIKASRYQFVKNLIVNQRCRLIVLEAPIDIVMLWDLYAQDKIDDSYKKDIENNLKGSFEDHKMSIDFIEWLRAYNSRSTLKVHLTGMDNLAMPQIYLFDYHLALLGKEKGMSYLKKIRDEKYEELATYAESDTLIKKLLDKQEFNFYISFLKTKLIYDEKMLAESSINRDLNMSDRVINAIKIYTEETETAAILAHSMHLGKTKHDNFAPLQNTALGFYLSEKYGSQFFSLSFQIGEGTYTQDECKFIGANMPLNLPVPPKQSFEYAGLRTRLEYFYYPAGYLGDDILSSCKILRAARYQDLYKFSNLKKEFDAYVFIRESKAIESIEQNPAFYASDFLGKKYRTMRDFFKNLKD